MDRIMRWCVPDPALHIEGGMSLFAILTATIAAERRVNQQEIMRELLWPS